MKKLEFVYEVYNNWCSKHFNVDSISMCLQDDILNFCLDKEGITLSLSMMKDQLDELDEENIKETIISMLDYLLSGWTNIYFNNNSN